MGFVANKGNKKKGIKKTVQIYFTHNKHLYE